MTVSFTKKSVCKFCGSPPKYSFYTRGMISPKDPNFIKSYKSFLDIFHLNDLNERNIKTIQHLSYKIMNKSYSPRFHKNESCDAMNYIDYLSCACGGTSWSYNILANINNPQINQRRAKY